MEEEYERLNRDEYGEREIILLGIDNHFSLR
jgi:hypothetical protein